MAGYWSTVGHELHIQQTWGDVKGIGPAIARQWSSFTHSAGGDWHSLIHFIVGVGWGGWIVCGIFGLIVYGQISLYRDFKRLPTLLQYLAAHPDCATRHGIRCCICNSGSLRSWGLHGRADGSRYFICNHCNRTLYRTG